jgi:hypothetical protein
MEPPKRCPLGGVRAGSRLDARALIRRGTRLLRTIVGQEEQCASFWWYFRLYNQEQINERGEDMLTTTEQVWDAFHGPLQQFIRRRVSDEVTAEDVLQDVFSKSTSAWRHSKM